MAKLPYALLQKIRAALALAEDAMWDIAWDSQYPDATKRDAHYEDPHGASGRPPTTRATEEGHFVDYLIGSPTMRSFRSNS